MRNLEPKDKVKKERMPGMPLFPKWTLSKKGRTFRKNMTFFLFMMPALLGLILFYIKPFGTVVQFSFVDNAYAKNFAGFKNFSDLFQNASFLRAGGSETNQSLLIQLSNGLVLQMAVNGERIIACGTWACPEFFDAFQEALQ